MSARTVSGLRAALAKAVTVTAALAAAAAAAHAQDVLVVTPPDLAPTLDAWTKHRAAQGLKVDVREPGADVAATVKSAHAASAGRLRFVLLLGDVDRVPCVYVPVEATAKWTDETRIATDAPYADVDGDGLPDLAIGRVPADSADEARAFLARSISYERSADFGEWRRRLNVVAGVGRFGGVQDAVIENITRQFLARNVPQSVALSATYGNPASAWCPPPAEFADTTVERINEGAFVVTYMGHGAANELDSVRDGRDFHPILGPPQVERIDVRHGAPLLVLVACSTGRFDAARDCLAEELLRRPRGPAVVIASSRVSTPYSNGILARELLAALWQEPAATAGELLVAMKRRMVEERADDDARKEIEKLAATYFERDAAKRAADRREHVALYNLLGDPCLRIARPAELPLTAAATALAGGTLEVSGNAPVPGRLLVEVVRKRDAPVSLARKTADEWRATYAAANAPAIGRAESKVDAGPFRVEVKLPADARPGAYHVRAYLEAADRCAAGSRPVDVSAPPAPPTDGK